MTAVRNVDSTMELVERARRGDAVALNELCARYLPRLQKFARARLRGWQLGAVDAQDLVQDTFAHVVQRIEAFEPRHENAFEAYLRQALMNRLRDELRWMRRRPTEPLDFDYVADAPSPVDEAIGTEVRARYEAALRRLRRTDREAIVARIEHGHSYPDVARVLGKPSIAAAHVAVSRALGRLAKEMQPEWA